MWDMGAATVTSDQRENFHEELAARDRVACGPGWRGRGAADRETQAAARPRAARCGVTAARDEVASSGKTWRAGANAWRMRARGGLASVPPRRGSVCTVGSPAAAARARRTSQR
jgi:hypothetical protein